MGEEIMGISTQSTITERFFFNWDSVGRDTGKLFVFFAKTILAVILLVKRELYMEMNADRLGFIHGFKNHFIESE